VEGTLYAKVFRMRDNNGEKNINGPNVVDQFFVREGISIPAQGNVPIQFTWDIPSYALSGNYKVATYFVTSGTFNLLGLSFTDDVVGNSESFTVSAEHDTGVYFNKDAVTVNNAPYFFAAYPPRHSIAEPITTTATIVNETDSAALVPVTWKLYYWDAQRKENLITEEKKTVAVPPNSETEVSFTASDTQYAVYLLEGSVDWKNAQSIINVRFAREGNDRARINFPGIMSFPIVKGKENTLFSCLHNAGLEDALPNGRLDVRLLSDSGKIIHEYTYTGSITSAMMGVAEAFIPKRTYDNVRLEAKLYQDGELVDSASIVYNCSEIDQSLCTGKEGLSTLLSGDMSVLGAMKTLLFIGGALALLILLVMFLIRIQRKDADEGQGEQQSVKKPNSFD